MKQRIANYTVLINKERRIGTNEDCYSASVPVLGIATDANSLEAVQKEIDSLIQFHLDSLIEEGEKIPVESAQTLITKYQTILPIGVKVSHA